MVKKLYNGLFLIVRHIYLIVRHFWDKIRLLVCELFAAPVDIYEKTSSSNQNNHREILSEKDALKICEKSLKIPMKDKEKFL